MLYLLRRHHDLLIHHTWDNIASPTAFIVTANPQTMALLDTNTDMPLGMCGPFSKTTILIGVVFSASKSSILVWRAVFTGYMKATGGTRDPQTPFKIWSQYQQWGVTTPSL
jgi:hypothetical protein